MINLNILGILAALNSATIGYAQAPNPALSPNPVRKVSMKILSDGKLVLNHIGFLLHTTTNRRFCMTRYHDELGWPVYRASQFTYQESIPESINESYFIQYFQDRYLPGECGWAAIASPRIFVSYFDRDRNETYWGSVNLYVDPALPENQHAGELICERFHSAEGKPFLRCEPAHYSGEGMRFNPKYGVTIRLN